MWAFPYSNTYLHVRYVSQPQTAQPSATPPPRSFNPLPEDQGDALCSFPLCSSALGLLRTGWCQERVRPKPSFLGPGRTIPSAAWALLCCRAKVHQVGPGTLGTSTGHHCQEMGLAPSQKRSGHGGGGWLHRDQWFECCWEPEAHRAPLSHSTDTAIAPG